MYTYLTKKNDFDLLGDELFNSVFGFNNTSKNIMRTDVSENDNEYLFSVELPGFEKENIKIEFNNGYLKIDAKNEKKETKDVVFSERRFGEVSREYYLGDNINSESIKANYTNGVLSVIVPKETKEKEKRYINIE